ncbi:Splicing factor 3A subunit 2 [Giardia duodenalis]|uniref:Splicing factor 3A subunit 2 n=1 Tax=Giardia intestinalis (strain ATCC 50803 / WB clone C6) TaxID=184922 RepID=A8BJH8_GIAIC|nr:Splicing factor 3A subunit 2 [Giardia intestinalis]KAE8303898.1 Splicing factor 3A subunit 2 [Giardia intestinalis]|eukprot:XP_001706586.1 Splicing factor 3A subunit 2 [Giardia lamblia ATCC 50803]
MPAGDGKERGVKKKIGVETGQKARQHRRKQRETIVVDPAVDVDPFCFKNYLGKYECKLCGTRHVDKESYAKHVSGKRHQHFLSKKLKLSKKDDSDERDPKARLPMNQPGSSALSSTDRVMLRKRVLPKWHVDEVIHPESGKSGYCVSLWCPKMKVGIPRYRIVSTYDQSIEPVSPDKQYIVISCHPYRSVGVCIMNQPIDTATVYEEFDSLTETYVLQLFHA